MVAMRLSRSPAGPMTSARTPLPSPRSQGLQGLQRVQTPQLVSGQDADLVVADAQVHAALAWPGDDDAIIAGPLEFARQSIRRRWSA